MRYYTLKLILRLLVLTIVMALTALAFLDDRILINRFILLILLAAILGELFWFLNYTNRQLRLFIESLRNEDYTVRFPDKGNRSIRLLNKSFQEVIIGLKTMKNAGESQQQYLETAFNRLNAGIISVTPQGEIRQMNQKAAELLGTGRLHSIASLKRLYPSLASLLTDGQPAVYRGRAPEHMFESPDHMLLELKVRQRPVTLSLRSTRIRIENEELILLAFHDIREALDHREIESWTRLIRILTHEIMNSVTPIAALSEAMHKQLAGVTGKNQVPGDQLEDLTFSLHTIQRRSEGLLSFVEDYRKFTRIGMPVRTSVEAGDFFEGLIGLFREELNQRKVNITIDIPDDTSFYADQVQAEQAVINILRNALDALENRPHGEIRIGYRSDPGFDCLVISDNGPGIPPDELREVFVPFFSTKKTGTGIGLSLARQILHGHGGTIDLTSVVNEGTQCTLFFPKEH